MNSDTSPFLSKIDGIDSFSDDSEYLSKEETDNIQPTSNRVLTRLLLSVAKACFIIFAIGGVIVTSVTIAYIIFPFWLPWRQNDVYRPETLRPGVNKCLCGHTKEEAISLGCAYDSLATAWLPQECRDDELTEKFDNAGPGGRWNYYLDENGTIPITSKSAIADLGPAGGSFWASRDWHIAHCVFYWQKYKRMAQTGVIMEARYDTLHHVEHCGKLILNKPPDYFFLIEVPVRMNGSFDENPTSTRISGKLPGHLGTPLGN
ncbi:hypothetical protein F5Y19DRAFT_459851 [Xylariaceae sp. FL1651]|nr:hypothetical protein F5Y19DRAFT_459851 [Xylariaceae sp. FL1651]